MSICQLLIEKANLKASVKRKQSTNAFWYAHMHIRGLRNMFLFRKFVVRYFLLTLVLRFALCLITNCISSVTSYNNGCRVCSPFSLVSYWIFRKKEVFYPGFLWRSMYTYCRTIKELYSWWIYYLAVEIKVWELKGNTDFFISWYEIQKRWNTFTIIKF